jgi:hypothetical protein
VIGHGGDTVLFHTELNLLPEEGVGIFYNFNSQGRENAVYGLRKTLFDGFMDRDFPPASPTPDPPALASAAADAQKIAGVYSTRLDPVVRALQLAGLLVIAGAAVGNWSLWRISKLRASRMARVRSTALAAALLGIVWIGFAGRLFSFNLNY